MPDAFKDCDGHIVPLVWQHMHDGPGNVLGHAELENRQDGVYAYCSLNDTDAGNDARKIVKHGDICALSIYANKLRQEGSNVMHGVIREVSLVLAGANPGAVIDNYALEHADGTQFVSSDEAVIKFVDPDEGLIMHEDKDDESSEESEEVDTDKTIEEIIDTMNEEQKAALYAIVGAITEDKEASQKDEKEDEAEDEEPVRHADEDGEETVGDVLDTLSDEQRSAVETIMTAVGNGDDSVPENVKEVFETLDDKQKNAVYAAVGSMLDDEDDDEEDDEEPVQHADDDGKTIGDILETLSEEQKKALDEILDAIEKGSGPVSDETKKTFDTFSEEQKNAVYAMVGIAAEQADAQAKHSNFEGDEMKYNIFDADSEDNGTAVLTHSDIKAVFDDAPRYGSLRESVLQHGITDIEVFFPEAQAVNNQPYQIVRRMEWVSVVLNGVHKSPFARIKSTAANLTEEQARAKGYIKGRKKIEEQISALKRVTTPQTIYKLQKLDRDDVVDITDFDVVAWMKQEMRMMLDEEVARAILIGDGRLSADPEKIFPDHIRPIWSDDEMYTIHVVIPANKATDYDNMIDEVVRGRKGYKGSGTPVMFIGPDILTEMRLLKDTSTGKMRYASDNELAEVMRVSKIHKVELFDDAVRTMSGKDRKLVALVLNLADYTVGANKGGEVSMFDDFDLDYNKLEYLIETRMSGALTMPKSAIAIEIQTTTDSAADPRYVKVANPVTADIADYFEMDEYGRLTATVDSAVVTGKDYYEVDE
jgi:hypothetical protein